MLASGIVVGSSLAALAPPALAPTLVRHLQGEGFTPADLAAIVAGRVVARGLPRAERDEAGAIGVVRINLAPDGFLARFRDIVRFERGGGDAAVGRLSIPAVIGDFEGYALPAQDVHDLAGCALDDCDVNLSAAQIARLRGVDRRGPGGPARLRTPPVKPSPTMSPTTNAAATRPSRSIAIGSPRSPCARRVRACCVRPSSCTASPRPS